MKRVNYLKAFCLQSEFDHRYACWAASHRGWAKMKESNKRVAKKVEEGGRRSVGLTMTEKRELLERIRTLVLQDDLNKEDCNRGVRCLAGSSMMLYNNS